MDPDRPDAVRLRGTRRVGDRPWRCNCSELTSGGYVEKKAGFASIDEYIGTFPEDVQAKLNDLRQLIRRVAPDAEEKISYQMPTFYLNGNLVHFAAHSNHIGFYPTPSGIARFKKELSAYKHSKGSVQFPMQDPLPMELIEKIVEFRVQEASKKRKK